MSSARRGAGSIGRSETGIDHEPGPGAGAGSAGENRIMRKTIVALLLWGVAGAAAAASVAEWTLPAPLGRAWTAVYQALENERLWVVFEADIGAALEGMAARLGEDYNRNRLEGIRSMVFCSARHANAVANADPRMLALCPLHLTLYGRDGQTHVVFVRPGVVAAGSPAAPVAAGLEQKVGAAIEAARRRLAGIAGEAR